MRTLALLLLLYYSPALAEIPSLSRVRTLFLQSGNDETSCNKLMEMLLPFNELNSPVFGAYKACANIMMANYVTSPFSKLSVFNTGKDLLEKCIKADSRNIELHYLRFAMQSEAPLFLDYNNFISADKAFLMNSIDALKDAQLKKMITSYLMKSIYLSDEEKKRLTHE